MRVTTHYRLPGSLRVASVSLPSMVNYSKWDGLDADSDDEGPGEGPAAEAARLTDKKQDYYASLPAVTIGRRRREAIACDLARLSAMAVGGHCFKNALASLQPLLQLGAARYGALMAAIGAPGATVTPLLGGLAFDAQPRRAAIVFASVALLGGAICAGGLVQGSPAAVLASVAEPSSDAAVALPSPPWRRPDRATA